MRLKKREIPTSRREMGSKEGDLTCMRLLHHYNANCNLRAKAAFLFQSSGAHVIDRQGTMCYRYTYDTSRMSIKSRYGRNSATATQIGLPRSNLRPKDSSDCSFKILQTKVLALMSCMNLLCDTFAPMLRNRPVITYAHLSQVDRVA